MDRTLVLYTLPVWVWSTLVMPCQAQVIYEDLPLVPAFAKAHGLTMGVAFVIIYPIGAILLRVLRSKMGVGIHAVCQLLGWVLMIAGLATGIRVGRILDRLHNNGHTILGTIIVVFLLIQPILGFYNHWRFRAVQTATVWTHIHIWLGRTFVILGIINGGLGLKLAANSTKGIIAYGVVAGVIGVAYCAIAALREGIVILTEKSEPQSEIEERE